MSSAAKSHIEAKLREAAASYVHDVGIDANSLPAFRVFASRTLDHGDYSSNVVLLLAQRLQRPPQEIAQRIADLMKLDETIVRIEATDNGFLNFFVRQ